MVLVCPYHSVAMCPTPKGWRLKWRVRDCSWLDQSEIVSIIAVSMDERQRSISFILRHACFLRCILFNSSFLFKWIFWSKQDIPWKAFAFKRFLSPRSILFFLSPFLIFLLIFFFYLSISTSNLFNLFSFTKFLVILLFKTFV